MIKNFVNFFVNFIGGCFVALILLSVLLLFDVNVTAIIMTMIIASAIVAVVKLVMRR